EALQRPCLHPLHAPPMPAALAGQLAEPAADRPATTGWRSGQTPDRQVQTGLAQIYYLS
ncbi:Unknown protein, partial [Striga hermonthica]